MHELTASVLRPPPAITAITEPISASKTVTSAIADFRQDIHAWIDDCTRRYSSVPPSEVHDQATFVCGWLPYLSGPRAAPCRQFIADLGRRVSSHYRQSGVWEHGYWILNDAHHGPEHFIYYLAGMQQWGIDSNNVCELLTDCAEHITRKIDGSESWIDLETGLFRALYFGTGCWLEHEHSKINIPDHLRFVSLALLAYDASHHAVYKNWAVEYGRRWADEIARSRDIPVALTPEGAIYTLPPRGRRHSRDIFHLLSSNLESKLARAESFIASDAVNVFLQLWRLTDDPRFLLATETIIDAAIEDIASPDAAALVDLIRLYRLLTDSRRYDHHVLKLADFFSPWSFSEIGLTIPPVAADRAVGIGKRKDSVLWLEDGRARCHNPVHLAFVADIKRDTKLAQRALEISRAYFLAARRLLPDGRDDGCSGRTISSVMRGHGRDNGTGVVNAVLLPLEKSFRSELTI